jgi:sarcosine oxidase subunit gamma
VVDYPFRSLAVEVDASLLSGALSLQTRRGLALTEIVAPRVFAGTVPALPGPNQSISGRFGDLIWLAPRRFLRVDSTGSAQADPWSDALTAAGFHLVDCSHGRFALRASGLHARELIAKSCPLDLHVRAFPSGACAQSLVADTPMLLHAFDGVGIDLYMERGLARSATELLVHQAKEFLSPGAAHPRFLGLGGSAR